MRVFSKSARCPNNEIPSCEKACAYGISDKPTPKSGLWPDSFFLCSQVKFPDRSDSVTIGIECKCQEFITPIHTLLMPTFFGLNLDV